MRKTKILLTRNFLDVDIKYIIDRLKMEAGDSFEITKPESYDEAGILNKIKDVEVLLGPFVTKNILQATGNIKLIQVPWTGMDTFDFDAVAETDVTVCNSHSNSSAVAEFGVALLLDLIKKISYHDRKMRTGNWNRDEQPLDLKSGMMADKTVCILGYGNIGSKIGRIVHSFGSKILAVNKQTIPLHSEVYKYYNIYNWIDAIAEADICIITLPLTLQTKGLINKNSVSKIKRRCIIVNLSRSDIVDEDAIYESLVNGTVSGYASDVWWNSPGRGASNCHVSKSNRFEDLENVILSPHRAGYVEDTLPHLDDAIDNIANFILQKPLINIVNTESHY